MARNVIHYLCSELVDHSRVDSEVLLTAGFYLETWKHGSTAGPDEELAKLLAEEEFDSETVNSLKQLLVAFTSETESLPLFQQAIGVLRLFDDPNLVPLFVGWLEKQVRGVLRHNAAMYQLLQALDEAGEGIFSGSSRSLDSCDANLEDARNYLRKKLGLEFPW